MNTDNDLTKKKVLYVEENSAVIVSPERYHGLCRKLSEKYDLFTSTDLSLKTVHLVDEAQMSDPYEALITHMPSRNRYSDAIELVEVLRSKADIPIVAYTGAALSSQQWMSMWTDAVLSKTDDVTKDFQSINGVLMQRWGSIERRRKIPSPVFRMESGTTRVRATVNLGNGLDVAAGGLICRFAGENRIEAQLERLIPKPYPITKASVVKLLDLLALFLTDGTEVEIIVKGTDDRALFAGKKLYYALSASYAGEMPKILTLCREE